MAQRVCASESRDNSCLALSWNVACKLWTPQQVECDVRKPRKVVFLLGLLVVFFQEMDRIQAHNQPI